MAWRSLVLLLSALVIGGSLASPAQARRVRMDPDVPGGLQDFQGVQPFLTGVPIPEGELPVGAPVGLVDARGEPVLAQFEIAATWRSDRKHVRWLLVDGMASIRNGKAEPLYLVYGPEAEGLKGGLPGGIEAVRTDDGIVVGGRNPALPLGAGGQGIGRLILVDGTGNALSSDDAEPVLEKNGPVRAVVKWTGTFRRADGMPVASYLIRARFHPGTRMIRMFVTLTWLTDDKTEIQSLTFEPAGSGGSGGVVAGLDGAGVDGGAGDFVFRQTGPSQVLGLRAGKRLDGWVARGGDEAFFLGLRWPWQQFPTAVRRAGGRIGVCLIGPEKSMSLAPRETAVPGVLHNVASWNLRIFKGGLPGGDVIYNGPDALPHLTPRGIAKTWELVVWPGDPEVPPSVKNLLTQHPVLAHADPEFATLAAVPSPMNPVDHKRFGAVERALKAAFSWFTRELESEGDFGTWNYGDLQWDWTLSGTPIYRYWMNLGKGWSVLPWVLWVRSGDRLYFENGEANSRHAMDVDTCHVPDWERSPGDFRLRGGQYHYSALHWGYGPEVFTYYVDSEYLPYAWYCTGLERAKDCLDEHAEAMKRYDAAPILKFFSEDLPGRAGRHLYVMVKNYCVLYEATWDEELGRKAQQVLDLTLQAQMPSGNFPHVKTNHYLDEPLNIAARVFGWEKVGSAIQRWCEHLGNAVAFGKTGATVGPMSTWSYVNLSQHGGGPEWLEIAERVTNTQAASVLESATEWNGINAIPGHEAGPALRDWPIVMRAMIEAGKAPDPQRLLPMQAFGSLLPPRKADADAGWISRHLAYVLAGNPGPVEVKFSVADGHRDILLRVIAPDGKVLLEQPMSGAGGTQAYDSVLLSAPFVAEHPGAYAVEILCKGSPSAANTISMQSSTGKLVHVLPEGNRNVFAGTYAGQFFFQPEPGASEVRISNINSRGPSGRIAVLDAAGRLLGQNAVTGSVPFTPPPNAAAYTAILPEGPECVVKAESFAGSPLLSAVMALDHKWNYWVHLKGMKPYISRTRDEWFDPAAYPSWPREKLSF